LDRIAVFVDAGYLFAQGSVLLTGSKKPRLACILEEAAAIERLRATARQQAAGVPLLRIYWYDGVTPRGMTPQQESIANRADVKLRLGFVNSQGEQKGVDSLIVTDLIDLARNQAMSDALVMSGD
jgi:NYN domain